MNSTSPNNVSEVSNVSVYDNEMLIEMSKKKLQGPLLVLRLVTLVLLVMALTSHIRSLRVFRWEQSVTGGVLVTYSIALLGLTLETGLHHGVANAFQTYICATGGVLLAVNAAGLYHRWWRSSELTRVVAELLGSLGVPLKRQVYIKVALSAAAAVLMLVDLSLMIVLLTETRNTKPPP